MLRLRQMDIVELADKRKGRVGVISVHMTASHELVVVLVDDAGRAFGPRIYEIEPDKITKAPDSAATDAALEQLRQTVWKATNQWISSYRLHAQKRKREAAAASESSESQTCEPVAHRLRTVDSQSRVAAELAAKTAEAAALKEENDTLRSHVKRLKTEKKALESKLNKLQARNRTERSPAPAPAPSPPPPQTTATHSAAVAPLQYSAVQPGFASPAAFSPGVHPATAQPQLALLPPQPQPQASACVHSPVAAAQPAPVFIIDSSGRAHLQAAAPSAQPEVVSVPLSALQQLGAVYVQH